MTIKKEIIKNICDSVNHTRFPKEDHLPYWAHRDNKDMKGDHAKAESNITLVQYSNLLIFHIHSRPVHHYGTL